MLQKIAGILILIWLLGLFTSYTIGGFIHIPLIFAVILLVVSFYQGEKIQWPPWTSK